MPDRSRLTSEAMSIVEMLGLEVVLGERVSDLPQGVRRMVAVARAVVMQPAIVCLDEPAAGLSEAERLLASRAFEALAREFGLGILLVEHNVDVVAKVCDEVLVLDFGHVIAQGAPAAVLADERVRSAYLGSTAGRVDSTVSELAHSDD